MELPYFDAHCDTISCCRRDGRSLRANGGHLDLERLHAYRKAAQLFAMFYPLSRAPEDGMFAEAKRQQAVFARELSQNADLAVQCRTGAEIAAAHEAGKVAALLSCEGSELLNCDPDHLDWAHDVGVRAVNLTWNHANFLCGSNVSETERGLNELGRAFVRRAQELDILIDVSHCSDAAFWDLIKITRAPVIASHSNARAVCAHPRNLSDDMFRALCETGGVAGINFYTAFLAPEEAGLDDAVRHIEHFLDLGGEKHIGLGGDWDGCSPVFSGIEELPLLYRALEARGYDEALLEDLFYNNFLRVFS